MGTTKQGLGPLKATVLFQRLDEILSLQKNT